MSKKIVKSDGRLPSSLRESGKTERENRILDATVALLRKGPYSDLTVRDVAARAGVSPATAYNYFSSKNALVAAVYLRRLKDVPIFVDVNCSAQERVACQLRELAVTLANEPEVAAGITASLMGDGEEVDAVKQKIGREIRCRITSALGPGHWTLVILALEMIFYGALVQAATSPLTYQDVAESIKGVVGLLFHGIG